MVVVFASGSRRYHHRSAPVQTTADVRRRGYRRVENCLHDLVTIGAYVFIADKGLSLYPFHVDQLAIHLILLIYPVALFVHHLPPPWVPALVATLFFLVLTVAGLPIIKPNGGSSRVFRAVYASSRALNRMAAFLKSTGVGRRVISTVGAYTKWVTILQAASLGVLAFGLSVAVGGSSIGVRNADVLDAFLTQPFKAHADWTRLEGGIVVSSIAEVLEADWQPSRKCSDGSGGGDCDQQSSQFHGFPPEWGRTVAYHQPPYPPPPSTSDDSPQGPHSGPNIPPNGPSGDPNGPSGGLSTSAQSRFAKDAQAPRRPTLPLAGPATSRDRLYSQVTASAGSVWDAVSRAAVPDTPPGASFERIPQNLTPAQIHASRISFEATAPNGPVFDWSSNLVASLYKSAETGGGEAVKKLLAQAINTHVPVGELVGELIDLFLSGPAIEEVGAKTEKYVRERRFDPIASLSDKTHQAARGTLGKLHQVWAFFAGSDAVDDRKATAQFLRREMEDLFDKSVTFEKSVPETDLVHVRDSLVNHSIHADGSFNADTVDQVMTAISKAGHMAPP